jgi:hypothetical protein
VNNKRKYMKKPTKNYSELYSPEMKVRISEVHSMIMEQAGDLNLSTLIPNWKKMKMVDLLKSIEKVSFNLNEISINLKEEYEEWPTFSPKWRASKFGKMTMEELGDYAFSSPERRKEVRDMYEEEYKWLLTKEPKTWIDRSAIRYKQKQMKKGEDPFDVWYSASPNHPARKRLGAFIVALTLFLQLMVYLLF